MGQLDQVASNLKSNTQVVFYRRLTIDKWREYVPEYPREWLCGYDYNYIIRNDLTYSVRAIPSLYILDKDKKVILKDATFDDVTAWIDKTYGEIYGRERE